MRMVINHVGTEKGQAGGAKGSWDVFQELGQENTIPYSVVCETESSSSSAESFLEFLLQTRVLVDVIDECRSNTQNTEKRENARDIRKARQIRQ